MESQKKAVLFFGWISMAAFYFVFSFVITDLVLSKGLNIFNVYDPDILIGISSLFIGAILFGLAVLIINKKNRVVDIEY